MCGIFGLIAKEDLYSKKKLIKLAEDLSIFSQSRGSDSSGFVFRSAADFSFHTIKAPVSSKKILKTAEYKQLVKSILLSQTNDDNLDTTFSVIGHSRLATNGSHLTYENNQPVIKDGIIGIHNGIVVNAKSLWEENESLKQEYDIDSEIIFSLLNNHLSSKSTIDAVEFINNKISGASTIATFFDDRSECVLYSNNGSLYTLTNKNLFIFASEYNIIKKLIKKNKSIFKNTYSINKIRPKCGLLVFLDSFSFLDFNYNYQNKNLITSIKLEKPFTINQINCESLSKEKELIINSNIYRNNRNLIKERKLLEYNIDRISNLKRCSKCVLPETFPFITFDSNGVCNYCNNYTRKNSEKPLDGLRELVLPYKKNDGTPYCLIPFSGGRDSTFVLHMIKEELGLNPIAYTYDWGMVTNLARRNISRVCGKLVVENIIVSADIRKKRRNIRLNIEAWLKNPNLGMIPLFMAGDKQFFKYANIIKKQNNINLNIWGINFLENTDFKVGFCGVPPDWNKKMIYSMSIGRQLKLFSFVAKNILKNPAYINYSNFDTIDSFLSRYINPRKDYFHFFDYYKWDEREIENIIVNEYDWEVSKDLNSTWRIGDGTASFYNYIYFTIAGFSEFDTFRSNQIREGMISREVAQEMIYQENLPRFESLKWYIEILGLNFPSIINRINKVPKLY